jgi:HEAT repeat protein
MSPATNANTKKPSSGPVAGNISLLIQGLRHTAVTRRLDAARQLGTSKDPAAIGPLGAALNDEHPGVRQEVILALGRLDDSAAVPFLVAALNDTEPEIRAATIRSLGRLKDPAAIEPLILCLRDKDLTVRIGAVEVLGKLGSWRVLPYIEKMEHDPYSEVRDAASVAAGKLRRPGR